MKNFWIFLKERFPIAPQLILAFGLSLSTFFMLDESIRFVPLMFSVVVLVTFVAELRFMDELKDYDKDVIAHPTRPLPRGLITKGFVSKLITGSAGLLFIFSAISFFFINSYSGIFLTITTVWLILMYKEFFVGESLSDFPMVYAISHQIVIIPLIYFLACSLNPQALYSIKTAGLSLLVIGSFFSYEVCRKLDPETHAVIKTYLYMYGAKKVIFIVTILLGVTVLGAYQLGLIWWVVPPAALNFLTLFNLILKPHKFKDIEGLISLNLIYNIWLIPIYTGVMALWN